MRRGRTASAARGDPPTPAEGGSAALRPADGPRGGTWFVPKSSESSASIPSVTASMQALGAKR